MKILLKQIWCTLWKGHDFKVHLDYNHRRQVVAKKEVCVKCGKVRNFQFVRPSYNPYQPKRRR